MDEKKKHDIALMRYSAIAEAVSGLGEEYPSLTAFYNDVAVKGVKAPDGTVKHFAPCTIESWLLAYKKEGFDGLIPQARCDAGKPRKLDEDIRERIRYFRKNYPRMTSSAIFRQLKDDGDIIEGQISESTVNRYVKLIETEEKYTNNHDMRRYERPHINEVWCGDSCVGPYLKTSDGKKHRVYVIALIDDASRFIVGIDVFFNDNFVNLMSVIRGAVAKYGRPKVFNFDNGASYRNHQMELLAARIGSAIHYCHPYSPTEKSKIERWFRTMKDQWMATLDMRDFHTLDELRGNLLAYVQKYNLAPHTSLGRKTPSDRFFSESNLIIRLDEDKIEKDFMIEIERRVSADSVIVIDQVEYEVDYRFAKQRIRLRYSADMEKIFVVEADGTLTPVRLLNKQDNANIKREKVHLCRNEEE